MLCTSTGSLVDGDITTAPVLASARGLADGGADVSIGNAKCWIAGAEGYALPTRRRSSPRSKRAARPPRPHHDHSPRPRHRRLAQPARVRYLRDLTPRRNGHLVRASTRIEEVADVAWELCLSLHALRDRLAHPEPMHTSAEACRPDAPPKHLDGAPARCAPGSGDDRERGLGQPSRRFSATRRPGCSGPRSSGRRRLR
jgi:hypothetical protein